MLEKDTPIHFEHHLFATSYPTKVYTASVLKDSPFTCLFITFSVLHCEHVCGPFFFFLNQLILVLDLK